MINYSEFYHSTATENDIVLVDTEETFYKYKTIYSWPDKVYRWNVEFNKSQLPNIQGLRLIVNSSSTTKLPEFIKYLPNLKYISIPVGLVLSLSNNILPISVKILHITGQGTISFPRDVCLSSIISLSIQGEINLKFESQNFPHLKNLETRVDSKQNLLNKIIECKELVSLNIFPCNNNEIFNKLGMLPLESLKIADGKLDSLVGIDRILNLENLWVQKFLKLTDLTPLVKLTKLKELSIGDCPNLKVIDSLIHIPKLENLTIFACKNIGLTAILPLLEQRYGSNLRIAGTI